MVFGENLASYSDRSIGGTTGATQPTGPAYRATLNANRAALAYWQLQLTRAHAAHALSASG